jgi:hypothetical protein
MSVRLVKEKNAIYRKKGKNSNFLAGDKGFVLLVAGAILPAKIGQDQIHLNCARISAKLAE